MALSSTVTNLNNKQLENTYNNSNKNKNNARTARASIKFQKRNLP